MSKWIVAALLTSCFACMAFAEPPPQDAERAAAEALKQPAAPPPTPISPKATTAPMEMLPPPPAYGESPGAWVWVPATRAPGTCSSGSCGMGGCSSGTCGMAGCSSGRCGACMSGGCSEGRRQMFFSRIRIFRRRAGGCSSCGG